MALSFAGEILDPFSPPVPENFLQVPPCLLPQHHTLLLSPPLPFPLDESLEFCYSLIDEVFPRLLPYTFGEDIPSYRLGSHLVSNVSRIVHQFEDSMRSVIPLAVAEFVNTSVASRSAGITFGEFRKHFRDKGRLENEAVGFPVRWQVTLLAKSDHLQQTRQAQRAEIYRVEQPSPPGERYLEPWEVWF